MEKSLIKKVLKFWYLPLIAGILYIILGIWVFATPVSSFLGLTVFLSIGIIISGIFELIYAISNRKQLDNWGWQLVGGALNLFVGMLIIANTGLTALMLAIFIGIWLLFRSVMVIINAFEIKRSGTRKWGWVLFAGIVGVLFSILLLGNPIIAGITVAFWMGTGLIIVGVLHILLSVIVHKMKKFRDDIEDKLDDYFEID